MIGLDRSTRWRRQWASCLFAVAALVVLGGAAAACKSSSDTPTPAAAATVAEKSNSGVSAGDAAIAVIQLLDADKWGEAWDLLHPAQQAVISRDAWIACAPKSNIPILGDLKVQTSFFENIPVPGTSLGGPSVAVIVQFSATAGEQTTSSSITRHMFLVDGEWRWILSNPSACT